MRSSSSLAYAVLAVSALSACAPRAKMCSATTECAAQSSCVAGRCQPSLPNVKPAIDTAKRIVVHPVDIAYVRRGDGPRAELPAQITLGKDASRLLLRFAVPIPAGTSVVEAYLVLRRSDVVDDDPAPISLHATRIVEGWNGRSTSWALQPRTVETAAPATLVDPGGPSLVRLDVRDLVRQWAKHDPADHGLAVVADADSPSGTTFAIRAGGADRPSPVDPYLASAGPRGSGGDVRSSSFPDVEPYLELYVR